MEPAPSAHWHGASREGPLLGGSSGSSFKARIHPGDFGVASRELEGALGRGDRFLLRYRFNLEGDDWRWLVQLGKPIRSSSGRILGHEGVLIVTPRGSSDTITDILSCGGDTDTASYYRLLLEISGLLCSTTELPCVLERVSRKCVEVLDVDLALVRLVEGDHLVVKGSYFQEAEEQRLVEQLLKENPLRVGEGIAGRVVQTGLPAVSGEGPVEELTLPGFAAYLKIKRWLLVPMRHQGETLGVITFISDDARRPFSPREVSLSQGIADVAAIAISNAQLLQSVKQRLEEKTRAEAVVVQKKRELSAILHSATMATESPQLATAAEAICEQALMSCNVRVVWLGLVVPESTDVVRLALAQRGSQRFQFNGVRWDETPWGRGPVGIAIRTRRSFTCNVDAPPFEPWRDEAKRLNIGSVCAVPLVFEETVRGALAAFSEEPSLFDDEQLATMDIFARHASLAVVNAALTREIRAVVDQLLWLTS